MAKLVEFGSKNPEIFRKFTFYFKKLTKSNLLFQSKKNKKNIKIAKN